MTTGKPGRDRTGIGAHLRALREQTPLTQTEGGRRDPRMSTIRRICDVLGARIHIGPADPKEPTP